MQMFQNAEVSEHGLSVNELLSAVDTAFLLVHSMQHSK